METALLEVGLVAFLYDGTILDTLQITIAPEVWNRHNRTFTGETIQWIIETCSINPNYNCLSYETLIEKIDWFFSINNGDNTRVWTKGHMDLEVLKDLYETLNKSLPWQYWQPRDLRTVMDLVHVPTSKTTQNSHVAVEDAIAQVQELCEAMAVLNASNM